MIPDPGGREQAPEPLRLVQAFVNTLDTENEFDELTDPAGLADALVEIGLLAGSPPTPLTDADLRSSLEVREALRALVLANNGVAAPDEAHRTLERAAAAARLTMVFTDGRARLVPRANGVDGALGRLVSVVHESMAEGNWWRLKGCPRDVCHWAFYDRSRNGSGKWCAMSVCGNRTNTKAYRRRAA